MKKKSFIFSAATGLLWANGVLAGDPVTEKDENVINSTNYIEDDADFELGFDTADYLPEGFDPYKLYFDLDSVPFIEENGKLDFDSKKHLPAGFDAYAYPTDVESINYIDENDAIELDFDTHNYLPEGFDAYRRSTELESGLPANK